MKNLKTVLVKGIIYSLVLTTVSCFPSDGTASDQRGYTIITIDKCEYIDMSHRLAHKGNCKNPIHECR